MEVQRCRSIIVKDADLFYKWTVVARARILDSLCAYSSHENRNPRLDHVGLSSSIHLGNSGIALKK